MALISCPECGTQVSSNAQSCPKCAYPIAEEKPTQPEVKTVQTIELTAKRYKLQHLFAVGLMFIGIASLFSGDPNVGAFGGFAIIAALIWGAIIRYLIWWHHK